MEMKQQNLDMVQSYLKNGETIILAPSNPNIDAAIVGSVMELQPENLMMMSLIAKGMVEDDIQEDMKVFNALLETETDKQLYGYIEDMSSDKSIMSGGYGAEMLQLFAEACEERKVKYLMIYAAPSSLSKEPISAEELEEWLTTQGFDVLIPQNEVIATLMIRKL